MLKIAPILPSKNEEQLKAQLKVMLEAAATLGVALDPDGFARSWLSDSTRVVVAHEDDKPVGFAILAFGRRYYDDAFTASVITAVGSARPRLLEFLLEMSKVLGAQVLFYEAEDGDTIGGTLANMKMVEVN
jgi:hypothetical protein